MNNLQLQVVLSAVDKLTAPFRNAVKRTQELSKKLKANQEALKDLEKTQNKMGSFSRMSEKVKNSATAVAKHTQKLEQLRNKVNAMRNNRIDIKVQINEKKRELQRLTSQNKYTGRTMQLDWNIKQLQKEYEKLSAKINENGRQVRQEKRAVEASRHEKAKQLVQLRELKRQLKASGIDVKNLGSHETELSEKIKHANAMIDQQKNKLERLSRAAKRQERYSANVERIRNASQRLEQFGQRSIATGAAIMAPVVGIGKSVVGMAKVAGEFERFQSILEVTEGSSEKAKQSFEWVKQFAVDTPANLDETMEAFVRLRSYGMDPTNGLLKTLGDTGAAMGKPVMQAVEAIADAVTGENERLKEFGIKGRAVKGSNIIEYEYTDKNGKQQLAKVDKTNRKQIESTLSNIFNEKYAGAMEKQSKTLMGVWAKLEDVWTNFQMQIMQTGAFDWIKEKLQGVLQTLDQMQQNGELKKWAEDIGAVIKEVFEGFWEFGKSLMVAVKWVAKFARENKGAIASFIKWSAIIGTTLIAFGAFNMVLSFALYPVARLVYGFTNLIGVNRLLSAETKKSTLEWVKNNKQLFSVQTTWQGLKNASLSAKSGLFAFSGILKGLPSSFGKLFVNMKNFSFWLNLLKTIGRVALSPIRLILMGIGSTLSVLLSPIGVLVAAFVAAGVLIYKYWDQIKAFFSGFFDGLMTGLAPVIERFKPLGAVFGVIVDWLSKAWKWFTDLFTPINATSAELESAKNAGVSFGQMVAKAIDLILFPLNLVISGVEKLIGLLPSLDTIKEKVSGAWNTTKDAVSGAWKSTTTTVSGVLDKTRNFFTRKDETGTSFADRGLGFYSTGGYVGNGTKYQPMGIVHGGEYVMTKEATSRLGVATLNALNYGKQALIAGGLGVSVATAAPIQIDNRPPLAPTHQTQSMAQPMNVNITINATANQNPQDIAREVARQLAIAQSRQQAQARNRMIDKD